ncbi:MAG: 1-(5-phosphoribosyl)-5-[(5-phosphoribosylamino)methylideneamino]imidazole-4-carboxamide isomerase [Candidatus Hydrogenedentota bacterium]
MRIVPAVDIRGGLCVNLVQGDYAQETVFNNDPVAQAIEWHTQGGDLVHIVDLDGAKEGRCCVERDLAKLKDACVPYEVGGGVRNIETVERVMALGAERVILGTAAHSDPDFLRAAAGRFPGRIAVGIDAKAGKVALRGWLDVTETDAIAFARDVERAGAARIIYTDILRDGKMQGPNIEMTRAVADAVSISVTASGGMSSLDDVRAVAALEESGVDEVIIGRALYLKVFTLQEAIAATRG